MFASNLDRCSAPGPGFRGASAGGPGGDGVQVLRAARGDGAGAVAGPHGTNADPGGVLLHGLLHGLIMINEGCYKTSEGTAQKTGGVTLCQGLTIGIGSLAVDVEPIGYFHVCLFRSLDDAFDP